MRVDNQNISGVGASSGFEAVGAVAGDGRNATGAGDKISNDVVALSSAASLVALARNVSSPDRDARLNGITAQFQSGKYQASPGEISRALISNLQTTAGSLR